MYLVLIGTVLLLMKFADFGPVATLSWWWVLSPFALAVAWWSYADASGWTQRRAMDRMDDRKEARRRKAFEALGLDYRKSHKNKKRAEAFRRSQQVKVEKVEGKRDAERKRHADTVSRSRFDQSSQVDTTQLSEFDTVQEPARK